MKTVKTWKNERVEFTTNWINEVVKPTIDRLTAKGKTAVLFTGIDNRVREEVVVDLLKNYKVKFNTENNTLSINWRNPGVDMYEVMRALSR